MKSGKKKQKQKNLKYKFCIIALKIITLEYMLSKKTTNLFTYLRTVEIKIKIKIKTKDKVIKHKKLLKLSVIFKEVL